MADETALPREYALVLLRKLAGDDLYRHHYELDPRQALLDIGVPPKIVAKLPPSNLQPVRLADKKVFLDALFLLIDEVVSVHLCKIQPQIHVFSPIKGGSGRTRIPFERR